MHWREQMYHSKSLRAQTSSFLESETGYKLPSESSLREQYLDRIVEKEKASMIENLESKIYTSISTKQKICVVQAKHLAKELHFISEMSSVKVNRREPFPVSIPPWPVLTRWSTWVKYGIFLVKHREPIFNWVNSLAQAGLIVAEAKRAFNHPAAQEQLFSLLSLERAVEVQREIQSSAVNIQQHFNLLQIFGTECDLWY